MKKIYLYGSGRRCRILLELLHDSDYQVIGVIDSDSEKWGQKVLDFMITGPEILKEHSDIYVCVTFYSPLVQEPTWDKLAHEYGIAYERQLSFHDVLWDIYQKRINGCLSPVSGNDNKTFFDASWGLGLGGVESWLKDMIIWCDRAGWEHFYLLSTKNQENMDSVVEKHIADFCYENTSCFSPEYINRGIRFLEQNAPCTLVFSRVDELLVSACLLKKQYPKLYKIIMVDHGSSDGMYRDILSYREMIDTYVCVSLGIKERLVSYGIPSDRIFSMTIPMPHEKTLKRTYSLKKAEVIRLGYAGRLEVFEKRMDVMPQLIQELENRNIKYILEIAGAGSYDQVLKDFIQEKDIEDHVHLIGQLPREEMPKFWQHQDIALNVSDNEGRPISNMEAMLNGTIPVATETIGILDDVHDKMNGFVVPVCDYRSMADRIEYLEQHRNVLPEMGEKAREEILKKTDLSDYMSMWSRIVNE